jgi:hypothetical protein
VNGLRVVYADGDPLRRGRIVGRAAGDLIERSLDFYRRVLARRGTRPTHLPRLLGPFLDAAERALPAQVTTLWGMAAGADVPFWELFAVNAWEELEPLLDPAGTGDGPARAAPAAERCSTVTVSSPGVGLLGHNEQWLAGDAGNVVVVVEAGGEGEPALVSPTVACCLPAVGINAHRTAQGIQSLAAGDDRVGVPRVLVSRHALGASGPDDAVQRAGLPDRAGGYGHSFAFPGGRACTVETSATRLALLPGGGVHTNHYRDPELAWLAPPPSPGSAARLQRLEALLAERAPATPAALMALLADHHDGAERVCEHGAPDAGGNEPDDEASAVLFSLVCDVEAGRAWVAPGSPCTTAFEEVELPGRRK